MSSDDAALNSPQQSAETEQPSTPDTVGGESPEDGMADAREPDDAGTDRNEPVVDRMVPQDALQALIGRRIDSNRIDGGAVVVGGDFAAENVTITWVSSNAGPLLHVGKVNTADILRREATYTHAPSDPKLGKRLRFSRLVFLDGMPKTGRETSAYLALKDRHSVDHIAVIRVDESVTLSRVAHLFSKGLLQDHGHLLWLPEGHGLDRATISTLEKAAEDRQATIVVAGHLSDAHKAVWDQWVIVHQSPDPVDVFSAHLQQHLNSVCVGNCEKCTGQCVAEYLAECLNHSTLQEELRRLCHPGECAQVAQEFAESKPRGPKISEYLELSSSSRVRRLAATLMAPENDVADPYREQRTQHQRAFRICYAAFHGHPLRDVFDTSERLLSLFDKTRGWEMLSRPTYHLSVKELLGTDIAEANTEDDRHRSGTGRLAQLWNERMPHAILDIAWNEYGGFRKPLLSLLDELVKEGETRTWQQAASVAGMLAGYDFDQIADDLVDHWSKSASGVLRQAAAYSMEVAAHHDDALKPKVRSQIRGWVLSGFSRRQDTAARAYATRLGLMFPEDALHDLRLIAADHKHRQSLVVSIAVGSLIPSLSVRKLFDTLKSWMEPSWSPTATHGTRIFVQLAGVRYKGSEVPELLRFFFEREIDGPHMVQMWQCALGWPSTARPAWDTLESWINVSHDGMATETKMLRELLSEVFSGPVLRRRANFYLRHVWKQKPPTDGFRWFAELLEGA